MDYKTLYEKYLEIYGKWKKYYMSFIVYLGSGIWILKEEFYSDFFLHKKKNGWKLIGI